MRIAVLVALIILVVAVGQNFAQHPTNGVENKAFDKTLSRLLSFSVPTITVDKLYDNQENYVIFDARESDEFEVSHLENAINIGYDNWDPSVLDDIDPQREIVIYCSIGYRSEKIAEKLQDLGYYSVYNLYGSIFEWVNRGYPLVNDDGQTTQVHAYNRIWGVWLQNDAYQKVY